LTGAIKDQVMRGFPVRLDRPGQLALFAYDNHTFIVESYLPNEADVTISLAANFGRLKNLVTGEIIAGWSSLQNQRRGARAVEEKRISFALHLPPHSYVVFEAQAGAPEIQ
jgi:hypothetical protein